MTSDAARVESPVVDADDKPLRWLVAAWLLLPLGLLAITHWAPDNFTYWLMLMQNRQLLLVWLAIAAFVLVPIRVGPRVLSLSKAQLVSVAVAIAIAGYAGDYWLLSGYDLSRDEQMASFDAMIYGRGHLAWPLPPVWQIATTPLNTLFLLPVNHPVAWVSAYLPGNSLLLALFGKLGDQALAGPVMNALSVLLVWGCARRIWPGAEVADREVGVVAVVLLAISGQFVMTGMTTYAMTAHLFCNLLWLWLFLRDRRGSDLAALAVGFVGIGLHQPLFHPLFVAPFMVLLLFDRRWGRLALFAGFYAAATAFWFAWPHLTLGLVSGPQSTINGTGAGYWTRLTDALSQNHDNISIMAANLLHFVTWQHLVLVPLVLAGFAVVGRDRKAAALAAGFVLPIVVMTVIMPFQGHGFGYRYEHGLLGNAALLGGFGWRQLQPWHDRLRPLFVRASMATLLVLMPMQGLLTHGLYATYARMNARIAAVDADYIILGEHDVPLALDFVLNRPDLGNRPIRLLDGEIDDYDALGQRLCHPGVTPSVSVALPTDAFFRDVMQWYNWKPKGHADSRLAEDKEAFANAGCRVVVLGNNAG